jgi:hypothetical protein
MKIKPHGPPGTILQCLGLYFFTYAGARTTVHWWAPIRAYIGPFDTPDAVVTRFLACNSIIQTGILFHFVWGLMIALATIVACGVIFSPGGPRAGMSPRNPPVPPEVPGPAPNNAREAAKASFEADSAPLDDTDLQAQETWRSPRKLIEDAQFVRLI